MKKIFLSILSAVTLFNISLSANVASNVIEIYNKQTSNIIVDITETRQGRKIIFPAVSIPGNQQWLCKREVDMNSVLDFTVSTPKGNIIAEYVIDAPGKTKYLSWDNVKSGSRYFESCLYPQTGPLMGLMGKTKSGLSLKNNVEASQIKGTCSQGPNL
jgi:hypothetical protein